MRAAGLLFILAAVTTVALSFWARGSSGAAPSASPSASGTPASSATPTPSATPVSTLAAPWDTAANGPGHLQPGSDPSVLPGDVLIVDKLNNRLIVVDPRGRIRWQFPQPGDLPPGQTFKIPDDAFFSPDGRQIIATEEDNQVISIIDVATHKITYRYGTPGVSGDAANYLDNPDDAMLTPNGDIISPDIKNCRLLVIHPPAQAPAKIIGTTTQACLHNPPARWGSPNGAFPMTDGNYLVTEINGSWADSLNLATGKVNWSVPIPGVGYPSDTNEISPGKYLTVDYDTPGQLVVFNQTGQLLYRYAPTSGPAMLSNPSLALPLPNGDFLVTDDYNHRVIVIDPRTSKIVWQYGVTGVAGSAPGYLDNPDGLDLVPPNSLLGTHAKTMGALP